MINEASDRTLRLALNGFIDKESTPILCKVKHFKDKELIDFSIGEEDFQTIKVQFKIEERKRCWDVLGIDTLWRRSNNKAESNSAISLRTTGVLLQAGATQLPSAFNSPLCSSFGLAVH